MSRVIELLTAILLALGGDGATASPTVGNVAAGSTDSGAPVKIGGVARTANPTARTNGQRVDGFFDKLGRFVVTIDQIREMVVDSAVITITSTTETTIMAAVASTYLDMCLLMVNNTSATAVRVDFRDDTAGTVRFSVYVPAGEMRGVVPKKDIKQTAVNKNWTAQLSDAVTDVRIFAQFVKMI